MFMLLPLLVETALLAVESQAVIERRLTMFASGDERSWSEAMLMVGEKVAMAADIWQDSALAMVAGAAPERVMQQNLGRYRAAVAENRARLSEA